MAADSVKKNPWGHTMFKKNLVFIVLNRCFADLGIEVVMCCSSDVLIASLNVYASALDQSL